MKRKRKGKRVRAAELSFQIRFRGIRMLREIGAKKVEEMSVKEFK